MPRSYAPPPHMRTASRSRVYHSSAVRPAFPSEVRSRVADATTGAVTVRRRVTLNFVASAATKEAKLDISIPNQARIDRTSVPRSQRSRVSVALATRTVQSGARCDGNCPDDVFRFDNSSEPSLPETTRANGSRTQLTSRSRVLYSGDSRDHYRRQS